MKKPVLIIMAAGMGSRYGGLKQIDPVTDQGEVIMDFSLYDAMQAGFEKAIFIIKREMEKDFRAMMEDRAGKQMEVCFAFQELTDLPEGYDVPEERVKPWGTAHAIMSARDLVDGPFAVINADDYYGREAFQVMYDQLSAEGDADAYHFAMVSFLLKNTVTEHGSVARGICDVTADGYLKHIVERTNIRCMDGGISYSEDDGKSWEALPGDTTVSMNFWGYSAPMMKELIERFPAFLDEALEKDPVKAEYMIPVVTDALIKEGKADVKVLNTKDRWYGITYKEDKENIVEALRKMKEDGLYPEKLWG